MLVWEAARQSARDIRANMVISRAPTSNELEALAEFYDAVVFYRDLEDGLSGFTLKQANSNPEIFININESIPRQKFTLAHEIGHIIERGSYANDSDYSFMDYRNSDKYDLHEFFADEFAGALLMPAEEFLPIYQAEGEFATAMKFGVTVSAVQKRARRLEENPDVAA